MFKSTLLGLVGICAAAAVLVASSTASASSYGCWIPTYSVEIFTDAAEGGDFSPNVRNCQNQCRALFRGCKGVASASTRCMKESVTTLIKADTHNCNDIEDPQDRRDCQNEDRADQGAFNSFLSEDSSDAKDDCGIARDDCLDFCLNEE